MFFVVVRLVRCFFTEMLGSRSKGPRNPITSSNRSSVIPITNTRLNSVPSGNESTMFKDPVQETTTSLKSRLFSRTRFKTQLLG